MSKLSKFLLFWRFGSRRIFERTQLFVVVYFRARLSTTSCTECWYTRGTHVTPDTTTATLWRLMARGTR